MRRITTVATIAAIGLALAGCGRRADERNVNLADEDNMLVPADEDAAGAGGATANDAGGADNMTAANAQ